MTDLHTPKRSRPPSRTTTRGLALLGGLTLALAALNAPPANAADAPPARGTITTVAGGLGEGVPARQTALGLPNFLALDAADGSLYITESQDRKSVLKVAPDGMLTVAAGSEFRAKEPEIGGVGDDGDSGPASEARFGEPWGVAVGPDGDLFIAEATYNRVRRVDAATGVITTYAGGGTVDPRDPSGRSLPSNYCGDGGPADKACLKRPMGLATDAAGNLFIADSTNSRVRKVDTRGVITTVAGNGTRGFCGDGGPATQACLEGGPRSVALDAAGNLYISELRQVRRVDARTGIITTVAGSGTQGFCGDSGPATQACLKNPYEVAVGPDGDLFIADSGNGRVRRVDGSTGIITTFAGTGGLRHEGLTNWGKPPDGDGGPAAAATLDRPMGVAVDAAGRVYIADRHDLYVRMVDTGGIIHTVAGNGWRSFSGDGGPATKARFYGVNGMAVDAAGNLYVADRFNYRVRRIDPRGVITTAAGNGELDAGFAGDGKPATEPIGAPRDVAVDAGGNLYFPDEFTCRIIKATPDGTMTSVAGIGHADENLEVTACGYSGDGTPARFAMLNSPTGVALDARGNLFIADTGNCRVRRVDALTGVITTVAGIGDGVTSAGCGYSGDGGPAITAQLTAPTGVAVGPDGDVYIADAGTFWRDDRPWRNGRIRRVDAETGIITTVAGNGSHDYCGDGGPATQACLAIPWDVAVDAAGNVFIADMANHRVRRVAATTGIITTVAGNSRAHPRLLGAMEDGQGYAGDGGSAAKALLSLPMGLVIHPRTGDLFIADSGIVSAFGGVHSPSRIRKITGVAVPAVPLPDLTVTKITGSQDKPHRVVLTATVANPGAADAAGVVVRFYDGEKPIGDSAPVGVAAGASRDVSVEWDIRGVPRNKRTITAIVDPDEVIAETDEGNNAASEEVSIRGNKARNGSFEHSSDGASPDGWSSTGNAGYDTGGDSAGDGTAVSVTGAGGPASLGNPAWTSEPIPVTPGGTYGLAMTVITQAASSAPSLRVEYLDVTGQLVTTVTGLASGLAGDSAATQVVGEITVPEGVTQLRLTLLGFAPTDPHTTGVVWFDDVWLW